MKRCFSALLALSLFVSSIFGRADIPIKDRVPNQSPGYCAWASLETMCRHQGIREGYDLLEKRKLDPDRITPDGWFIPRNRGDDYSVEQKLIELGINYRMNLTGGSKEEGLKLLVETTQAGHGAMIGVKKTPTCNGSHAIVVIDINSEEFEYIDSNRPGSIWVGKIDWLMWAWDGFVLAIEN